MRRWSELREQQVVPAPRWNWRRFQNLGGWQRCSLAFTSAGLALALVSTALALRKPNYPDAVAAHVLPVLVQPEEVLPHPDWLPPSYAHWPAQAMWRPRSHPNWGSDGWWATPRNGVTPTLISDTHGPPLYFGR
jgi:hypothetical protein